MHRLKVDADAVRDLCRRWHVQEMAVFGSVLREDFRPESDVDVLVTFEEDASWDLFDLVTLRDEISALFGRPTDLVEKKSLTNPFRRGEILRHMEVLYAA